MWGFPRTPAGDRLCCRSRRTPPFADRIAQQIERLGADDPTVREDAFQKLFELGKQAPAKEAARKELGKAAKESDGERSRAADLLKRLEILERMPGRLRTAKGLVELLLEDRPFEAWEHAVRPKDELGPAEWTFVVGGRLK